MKVIVDRANCAGNGVCEFVAPEFFELGDDGVMVLLRDTAKTDEEVAKVQEAVRSCPALALSTSAK